MEGFSYFTPVSSIAVYGGGDGALFAKEKKAVAVIRGLRAVSDFEYEFQMVGMNRAMDSSIETVFLMADARRQAIASKLVKEIAVYGGDIAKFVSPPVREEVIARVRETGTKGDY